MHTLVIIDDEDIVREGIQANLDWGRLGIDVVGTAGDGDEGLELIFREEPDIVISDIRMPTLDGLEMCEILHNSHMFPQIVFLSGYDEHEYARQALKLAAVDYLLKPFDPSDLERVVETCVSNIHDQRSDALTAGRHAARSALSEVLISASPNLTAEQHDAIVSACRLDRDSNLALVVVQLDNYPETEDAQSGSTLFQDCRRYVRGNPKLESGTSRIVVDVGRSDRAAILFSCASPAILLDECRYYTASIREKLIRQHGQSAFFGVSEVGRDVSQIPVMYLHAKKALHLGFFDRDHYTHEYERILESATVADDGTAGDKIVSLVAARDFTSCRDLLARVFLRYTARAEDVFPELKLECIRLCDQLEHSLSDPVRGTQAGAIHDAQLTIVASSSFREVHDSMLDLLNSLTSELSEDDQRIELRLRAAIDYINEHLADPITLAEVADNVYYSASRFSVRFSQMVGEPFSRYLARRRIETAKEIFQNEPYLRVYEVAERVGYTNAQYFSTLFKKTVGVSPLQYVASLR